MINTNNAELAITAGLAHQFPQNDRPQIVLSGRSNVGKSSIINMLINRKSLARVSGEPGKTITINFYSVDKALYLVDLPGYGFAKRAPEDREKWSALTDRFFTDNDRFDRVKLVLQLVDSRIGMTEDDNAMLDYLSSFGIPYVIVATKSDKLNVTEKKKSQEMILRHPLAHKALDVIFSSAKTKEGKNEIWNRIFDAVR